MTFYRLFEGNPDAFGVDTDDGGVRCVRNNAQAAVMNSHLCGIQSVGIYPMRDNMVKWGCTDIDTGSWDQALMMWRVLDRMQMHPWIEISRSKGYHVWVFGEEWMPAWYMRRAFLFAHHVTKELGAPVPPTEVNPKAEWLDDGKLGNFVRLPYFGKQADENDRRIMLTTEGEQVAYRDFLDQAETVPADTVRSWADRYAPPKRRISEWTVPSAEAEQLAKRLTGLGYKIWRDGPPEWMPKRSNTMAKLAIECKKSGLTEGEALILISDLDERLQKWTGRSGDGTEKARRSCVEWGYANA